MADNRLNSLSRRDFLTAGGVVLAGLYEEDASAVPEISQHGGIWRLENRSLQVQIQPDSGRISVLDKFSRYLWKQPDIAPRQSKPVFQRIRRSDLSHGAAAFECDFDPSGSQKIPLTVTIALLGDSPDMFISAESHNLTQPIEQFLFLPPFLLDTPNGVLAVADICDGHLYPLRYNQFPVTYASADRLDMPWFGVCDLEKGMGYLVIYGSDDDAFMVCGVHRSNGIEVHAPQVGWRPRKRTFGYPRWLRYHFVSKGGYVELAKAYRSYAAANHVLITLKEKAELNPNVRRLYGAVDVWGDASLKFARQAKSLGVERMLIHGRSTPSEVAAINALGYLTSEYDDYDDILPLEPGKQPDSQHDVIPGHVVLMADDLRMKAWLTWDKKTQFMKRCPAYWVPTAEIVIPKVLSEYPFLGRFIDVITAEGLYECYDPNHPLTRTDKRHCGENMLNYVKSLGLVVGGEHGIWWAVPYHSYIEGMMSGGYRYFSWPAGYLIHPKTINEHFKMGVGADWAQYLEWGIGHRWRAPLWELAFHDCIVPTWYWGDSNDFLLEAAPEITSVKDAFNILYGTMPMLWADANGSWNTDRKVFLRTCRNVCHLTQLIAPSEMISHEFLNEGHALQRTRFSNGTEVWVNFGREPAVVRAEGRSFDLPQNGFWAKGPGIEQSRALISGQIVTEIRAGNFHFREIG